MIFHKNNICEIMQGDCRESLQALVTAGVKVQTCITSPPYFGLRDYGCIGQLGLEKTLEQYIETMVSVFRLVRNVLTDDGTLWLNMGDSYAGSGKGRNSDGTHSGGEKQNTNKGAVIGKLNKINIGDCKAKDLIGVPWALAFALRADGWYLRQDIIWAKPNPMPESVIDRCTKSHEYIFLLSKSPTYYYDAGAIRTPRKSNENARGFRGGAYCNNSTFKNEQGGKRTQIGNTKIEAIGGRDRTNGKYRNPNGAFSPHGGLENPYITANKRSVWHVATTPYKNAHFATFPPELITPCILAGSRVNDCILDPFGGSGTTGAVGLAHGRNSILCELNPEYISLVPERVSAILKRY